MTLLNACTSFCTAVDATLGPTLTEYVFLGALAALGWWRTRKTISKVEAKAEAGIAAAKAEARQAHVSLARIEGSLRPAGLHTPTAPTLGTSSSQSGNFEKVDMPELDATTPKPRPSMPDPRLRGEEPLPPPSKVPDYGIAPLEEHEPRTSPQTPSAKRRL